MNSKNIGTILGIIGSVASIISLIYFFIPRNNNLNLSVLTTSVENLTQSSEKIEPELKIEYQYKGIKIDNLWKYSIRFINDSDKTLVGISTQKNILKDYLVFKENDGLEILDFKNITSQFNHKLLYDSSKIKLYFEQWRPNEYLDYIFYVKSISNNPDLALFTQPNFRQIVDGDIIFGIKQKDEEVKMITQIIPTKGRKATYIISFIIIGSIILVITVFVILIPFSYYETSKWYKNNHNDFKEFIKNEYPDNVVTQDRYISDPKELPKNSWNNFNGEKFPDLPGDLDINGFFQFAITFIIFLIMDLSLISTFIDLIYIFP